MAVAPRADGHPLHAGARAEVHCVACGSRFEADGVETGATVRCPLCREVVLVAQLVASKRRYRSRTPARLDDARRISRTKYRRLLRVIVAGIAAALAAAALLARWDAI